MTSPARWRIAAAIATTIAAAAVPAAAHAATDYSVSLCATGTSAANVWSATGTLTSNVRGVECAAGSGEPSPNPATGPRGVFVLQHPGGGPVSSAGDPESALTLTVPGDLQVTGGTAFYRGGVDSAAWRAFLRADTTTIAGCFANATSGPDSCAYDYTTVFFSNASQPQIPAGTRTLTVGLRCASVRANGATNTGCAGSNPATGNSAYSAVVGGSINVSDTAAPTGTATLTETRPDGTAAEWTRSADLRLRISSSTLADVGRGVCGARLAPTGAELSSTPLQAWTATQDPAQFRQCTGISADGLYDLSGGRREGVQQLQLTATDSTTLSGNRTTIATTTVRTDDSPPTITWTSLPETVAGGTMLRITPDVADGLSGVSSQATTAVDQNGQPVAIANDGSATIAAGATVTITTTATDQVANTTTVTRTIRGTSPAADPPPTTSTTTTTTTPTSTTPATGPSTPPAPKPATPASPSSSCSKAKSSSITTATWSRKTRRLTSSGCRTAYERLRIQLQVRHGKRHLTRTYALSGTTATWKRTLRTRAGETPLRARILRPKAKRTAWRTIHRSA